MSIRILVIIGTGGFLGSVARYLTQQGITKFFPVIFPYGTFAANIGGCFLIGIFYALADRSNAISPEWRFFLTTGFCGGYTTFSTFSYESYNLIRDEQYLFLSLYIGLSVAMGIMATFLWNHFNPFVMTLDRNSKLLRIFLGELDKYKGVPLYESIVLAARKNGVAGATVFRGILSYGASSRIHAAKLLDLSLDLPIIVEIVDTQEKIDEFIEIINPMIEAAECGALITIEAAEVIRYKAKK